MSDDHEHKKKKKHGGHGHGHGGGGHEEHEGAPEWLISFADNVVLLMGFFVILLAMNMKPATSGGGSGENLGPGEPSAATLDAAIAIREAFNNPVDLGSHDPKDLPLIQRLKERSGESEATSTGQKGAERDVRSLRPSMYFSRGGLVEFDDGGSAMTDDALEQVRDVASTLSGMKLIVELRGHVSAAEAFDRPDRGMQLSFERAAGVAEALAGLGFHRAQLRIIACADTERLVSPAYDRASHRKNQRVEIVVTDRVAQDYLLTEDRPARKP